MNNVIIRDVEINDILSIKTVINEVWEWDTIIEDEKTLDAAMGLYLSQVLLNGTFGRVAVLNNKVVGVIFGSVDGVKPQYRMLMEDATAHAMTLFGATERDRKNFYEVMLKLSSTYKQLMNGIRENYNGTLDFLVLAEYAQGLGIGKSLWLALKEYFEENKVKSIYLYSDTECNFGFYESQGFTKRREIEVEFNYDGELFKVNEFLYDLTFS